MKTNKTNNHYFVEDFITTKVSEKSRLYGWNDALDKLYEIFLAKYLNEEILYNEYIKIKNEIHGLYVI